MDDLAKVLQIAFEGGAWVISNSLGVIASIQDSDILKNVSEVVASGMQDGINLAEGTVGAMSKLASYLQANVSGITDDAIKSITSVLTEMNKASYDVKKNFSSLKMEFSQGAVKVYNQIGDTFNEVGDFFKNQFGKIANVVLPKPTNALPNVTNLSGASIFTKWFYQLKSYFSSRDQFYQSSTVLKGETVLMPVLCRNGKEIATGGYLCVEQGESKENNIYRNSSDGKCYKPIEGDKKWQEVVKNGNQWSNVNSMQK